MKFTPPTFPTNPTPEQWTWWRQCFIDGLAINEITDDKHKLTFLRTSAGAELYSLLSDAENFSSALGVLDAQFKRPTRALYARHQLLTAKQRSDESIMEFNKRLNILVEKCDCKALSLKEHKDSLLRDALIAGLKSDIIRARLLELTDSEASLADCLAKAAAVELSTDFSKSFQPEIDLTSSSVACAHQNDSQLAASSSFPKARSSNKQPLNSNSQCTYCGQSFHQRNKCPARNASCLKCGKPGHWAKVCRSHAAAVQNSETQSSQLCTINTLSTNSVYYPVKINGNFTVLGLIDPGSTESFITSKIASDLRLPIKYIKSSIRLANGSDFQIHGYTDATIEIEGEKYSIKLLVAVSLVSHLIIGMDVLAQHDSITLVLGGKRPSISLTSKCCSAFPHIGIDPPPVFANLSAQNVQPVATKSRNCSRNDRQFMQEEVKNLLGKGIIEESRSPWRSQAFVVRKQKPRMVIDYSATINRFTQLDAYPFPSIENLIDKAAENSFFSKIDLKSAYHQIPLRKEDKQFTAFEVDGKLYQFTRMPFGITNAVPSFQRIMDKIIADNKLQKTFAYLDDIIVCGESKSEHDLNLKRFLEVVNKMKLVLNQEKCQFGLSSIPLLGYIIENKSKKPNPEKISALLNYPIPSNPQALRRLLGFFAYNAKWVPDYANKVSVLLQTLAQTAFPLPTEAIQAIAKIKADISKATLSIPKADAGPLLIETDASGNAIGAVLSQANLPIAYFSRTLQASERSHSVIEREAMAIVEACRKWSEYLYLFPTIVKTDQRSVSFLFSTNKSRIKNEKIARWRLELSNFKYDISYRKGSENILADTMSRAAAMSRFPKRLIDLHHSLAHPGLTRQWEYIQRHKLPFSLEEVRELLKTCRTCLECKPSFYKPPKSSKIIRAMKPFERLGMDIIGPKPVSSSQNRFVLRSHCCGRVLSIPIRFLFEINNI